ncbi:hypothetical protein ACTNF7_001773 [Citrobacter braakii]|uniref:hypothetical protein n=1 Tax=Citrobacter braakii TaxID=57706 RepID=UPI00242F06E2|nr:hypothetical protein [Citrobacter braakii]WGA84950.1 hypothetical protein NFL11_03915 [Citrobacter braakii]
MSFDVDAVLAAAARWKILTELSQTGCLFAGMYLDFPGFAHVTKLGDNFILLQT